MRELKKKRTFVIVAIVVIFCLGVISWLGWQILAGTQYNSNTDNSLLMVKKYKDSANFYAVDYPISFNYEEAQDCCGAESKDRTKHSRPVSFRAPNYPREHVLEIQADNSSALSTEVSANWQSNFHTPKEITINGRTTQYVLIDFSGDNESYVEHNYLISAPGGGSVFVAFRERYQQGESSWDAAGNIPAFEAMVKSISLL